MAAPLSRPNGVIDVHHHFIPPRFVELWDAKAQMARGLKLPSWSESGTLKLLEETGLEAAILSLGHCIHPYVDDRADVGPICREINVYAAKLRDAHPRKLGFFATLPRLDWTTECIEEIRYAFDELQADGVVIFTSYTNRYLGHPDFRPVWQEFHRRSAVILVHPGFEGMIPVLEPRLLAPPIIDWTHETTRTALHLVVHNIMSDFPDCRIILSHAGGTLPYVVNRASNLCRRLNIVDKTEAEFAKEMRKFFIDVAFSAHDPQLKLLKDFAEEGHVLFGSDFPWEQGQEVREQMEATIKNFPAGMRTAAIQLFPRFAQVDEIPDGSATSS